MTDEAEAPDAIEAPSETPAAAEEGVPAAPVPVKRKPLSPAQWIDIRTRAELGTARVSELAREFGISASAVGQHLRDHGIKVGAKAPALAAAAAVTAAAVTAATAAAKPTLFAEKRTERLEETREFYYTAQRNLDRILMSKVGEQLKTKSPLKDILGDIKALNIAKRSLLLGRSECFRVLDADAHVDAASLPDLVIRDLTGEEITSIQQGDDVLEQMEEAILAAEAGEDDDG